jgi:hypothetical protein
MARLAAAADRLDYWIHTAPDCCPGVQITVGSAVGKLGLCLYFRCHSSRSSTGGTSTHSDASART